MEKGDPVEELSFHADGVDLPRWALALMLAVFMVAPTLLAIYVILEESRAKFH